MNYLFTGGGSGGHILPNIALIKKIPPKDKILYIGERGGMEEKMVRGLGTVDFQGITAGKLRRYFDIKNFFDIFKVVFGIFQSFFIIWKFKPDVVFAKGGYVSLPVVLAASLLRKNIIIHESDVKPGLTTRLCARYANMICISWTKTKEYLSKYKNKLRLTGIPIRCELNQGDIEIGRKITKISPNESPLILILGGSLGAKALNDFIKINLRNLTSKFNIIHIVGKGKCFPFALPDNLKNKYSQLEFVGDEIKDIFALSDIIISRSGSTFLAEFEYVKKPVILIPLPSSVSRGDQLDNANEFKIKYPNKVEIIPEEKLEINSLLEIIKKLLDDKTKYPNIEVNASSKILELMKIK